MKRVKINGRVAEDGSLILPPGVLESLDAQPGSLVCMTGSLMSMKRSSHGSHTFQ